MAEEIQTIQLETFLAVVRAGSASRAAKLLLVSQPTVAGRIMALEESLGARLFDRSSTGSRLTAAGRALVPHAERVSLALAGGRRAVADISSGYAGLVEVASMPSVAAHFLPRILREFQAIRPMVHVSLSVHPSEAVLQLVLRGEAEVGLMRKIHHRDIATEHLYTDQSVLVVHPGHAFDGATVTMNDLSTERLVVLDRSSTHRDLVKEALLRAGIEPLGYLEVDGAYTASQMVQQEVGIAFLPHWSVQKDIARGHLVAVRVKDATPMQRQLVVATRRDRPSSRAAATLIDIIRQVRAELPRLG